jgi:hypothetical protein
MRRTDAVLRCRWVRRPLRVVWLTEQSSATDKWLSLSNEVVIQTSDIQKNRSEVDRYWSSETIWLLPLPIFGRPMNASIWNFPWRGVPKYLQFLCPQGISISTLHYLLQLKVCCKYICLLHSDHFVAPIPVEGREKPFPLDTNNS